MKKNYFLLLLMLCMFSIESIAQKEKTKKKKKGDPSSYSVPVPPSMEEKVVESVSVREYSGTKDEGDRYDIVEAPRMVEEAPYSSNYYGNRTSRKIDTSKKVLDISGKYFLVTIGNNSTYYHQFGVEDVNGKTILPTVYSAITKCDDGYIVKLGSVSSLLDTAFKTIFPMEFSSIDPIKDKGLYLLRKRTGTTKIVDKDGIELVKGNIRNASPLSYGYSSSINNKTDFLQLENMEGKKAIYDLNKKKLLIGFVARNISVYENAIVITDDTCSRILSSKDMSPIVNEAFSFVMPPKNGGDFIVSRKGKMGLVSTSGKYVLPCEYNNITQIENSGVAALYIANKNNRYICVDYLGKNILNETFDYIRNVYRTSSYQLLVKVGNKYGVRDYLNHNLVPIEFDTIYNADYGSAYNARKGNKVVIYSNQGSIINELEFEKLDPVGTSGTFIYQKNNKVGLATSNFELLTEALYDKIEPFNAYGYNSYSYSYGDTHFKATKAGKMGLISRRGEVLLPFIYDLVEQLDEYAILLKQNGKYGLAKSSGYKTVAACEYDAIGNAVRNNDNDRYNQTKKYIGIKNGEAINIGF